MSDFLGNFTDKAYKDMDKVKHNERKKKQFSLSIKSNNKMGEGVKTIKCFIFRQSFHIDTTYVETMLLCRRWLLELRRCC